MRKSIALFLTLSFLTILLFILSLIFDVYQKETKQNFSYIYQNSLNIKSILNILNKIDIKEINSSKDLKFIFKSLPISSKDGNFRLFIKIEPLFNRININKIVKNGKINNSIYEYLQNILRYYNIKNSDMFIEYIIATIKGDDLIKEIPYKDYKKGLFTKRKFQKLLNFFKKYDKKITFIDWDKYLIFEKKSYLDCDLINKDVKKFLEIPQNSNCKNINEYLNKERLKELDIIPFNKQNFLINITLNSINIKYDLAKKKVISIENHPIY